MTTLSPVVEGILDNPSLSPPNEENELGIGEVAISASNSSRVGDIASSDVALAQSSHMSTENGPLVVPERLEEGLKPLHISCFTTESACTFDPLTDEWKETNAITDVHSWSLKFVDMTGGRLMLKLIGKVDGDNRSWESTAIRTSMASDIVLCKSGSVYRLKPPFLPFSNTSDPVPEQVRQILKKVGLPSNWSLFQRFVKEQRMEEKENELSEEMDDSVPQRPTSQPPFRSKYPNKDEDDDYVLFTNNGIELMAPNDSLANSPSKRFLPGPPTQHRRVSESRPRKRSSDVEYYEEMPDLKEPDDNYMVDPDFAQPALAKSRVRVSSQSSARTKNKNKKKTTFNDSAEFHAEMERLEHTGATELPLVTTSAATIPSRSNSTQPRKPKLPRMSEPEETVHPTDAEVLTTRYGRHVVKPSGDVGRSRKVLDADGNFLGIDSTLPAFDQFASSSASLYESKPPRRSVRSRKAPPKDPSDAEMDVEYDVLRSMDDARSKRDLTLNPADDSSPSRYQRAPRRIRAPIMAASLAPVRKKPKLVEQPDSPRLAAPHPSSGLSAFSSIINDNQESLEGAYNEPYGEELEEHQDQLNSSVSMDMTEPTPSEHTQSVTSRYVNLEEADEIERLVMSTKPAPSNFSALVPFAAPTVQRSSSRSAVPLETRPKTSKAKATSIRSSNTLEEPSIAISAGESVVRSQSRYSTLKSVDRSVTSEAVENGVSESTFERQLDDLMKEPEPTLVRPVSTRPSRAKASGPSQAKTRVVSDISSSGMQGEASAHDPQDDIWTSAQLSQLDQALMGSDPSGLHYLSEITKLVPGKTGEQVLKRITHLKEAKIDAGSISAPSIVPKPSKPKSKAVPPSPLTMDSDMRKKKNRLKLEAAEAELLKTASEDAFDDPKFRQLLGFPSPPTSTPPSNDDHESDYVDDQSSESNNEDDGNSDSDSFLGSIRSSRSQIGMYKQRLTQSSKAKLKISTAASKHGKKASSAKSSGTRKASSTAKRTMKTSVDKGTKLLSSLEMVTKSSRDAQDEQDEIDLEGGIAANFDDY